MLEYIKIYKNFHKTSEVSQLVNDCDLSMYTLHNFDKDYNSISKLNDIKKWCEDSGIYSLKEYMQILNVNIRKMHHIFNEPKLNCFDENYSIAPISSKKLDTKRKYLSIDLKHAYSQFIDSLHVFDDKFENIVFNGLPDFIRESKKARVFMYLQIPSHSIFKHYIYRLFDKILESDHKIAQYLKEYNLTLASCNIDELIYDITEVPNLFDEFIGDHNINGIDIHLNIFEQHYISFIDPLTNKERTIPIKEYTTHTNFITNSCPYMNQLYKVYNDLPIIETDLYIPNQEFWNKIIKLDEPIKITDIQ